MVVSGRPEWALFLAKPQYCGFESLAVATAVLATCLQYVEAWRGCWRRPWLSRRDGRYRGLDYIFYVLRFLEAPTNFTDEYHAAPPIGDTVLLQYANTYRPQIRHHFRMVQWAPRFGSNARDGGLEVTGKGG